MSSQSLRRASVHRSLRKQRLAQLQNGFISRFTVHREENGYSALVDKHAYNYFLHRPVKKRLRRLAKVPLVISSNQAISLQPISTHNQKTILSLTNVIQAISHHHLSERTLKPIAEDESGQKSKRSALKLDQANIGEKSRRRLHTFSLFDPYTQSLKPTAINKIRKNKLESLKRKKCIIRDKTVDKTAERKDDRVGVAIPAQKAVSHATEGYGSSRRQSKISKSASKVEDQNQVKHTKLLHFINKKKSELSIPSREQQ